jgi:hypothetical protein
MAQKTKRKQNNTEGTDGAYILKLTLYVILGSLWIKISKSGSNLQYPIPIGLIIGIILTSHEHFRVDRKIEYAVLVVAALFGFIAPYGLYINI